jgi:hypothetical protein
MSFCSTEWRLGYWCKPGHRSGYVTIGFPIKGAEKFGDVAWYAMRNGLLDAIRTEVGCPGSANAAYAYHDIVWSGDKVASCTQCDLVVAAHESGAFGFEPTVNDRGQLTCDISCYEPRRHGPYSFETLDEAYAASRVFLDRWTSWHGEGPWYATYHQDGEDKCHDVLNSKPDPVACKSVYAYSGPYDTLAEAYRSLDQRVASESSSVASRSLKPWVERGEGWMYDDEGRVVEFGAA